MLGNRKSVTVVLSLLLVMISSLLFSGKVYAGDSLADCGDNLKTGYSSSTASLYIDVKDDSLPVSKNIMDDYCALASPWNSISTDVEYLYIGDGVYSIGDDAFEGMTNLKTVFIPASIKAIGSNAFKDCDSISIVCYGGTYDDWEKLKAGSGITPLSSNKIIYDKIHVMNLDEIKLQSCEVESIVAGNGVLALQNTMNYLAKEERIKKYEDESKVLYDVDTDGVFDFKLKFPEMLEVQLEYQTSSTLHDFHSVYTLSKIKDKSIYEYLYRNTTVDPKYLYFYDKIIIEMSNPDLGQINLDLTSAEREVTGSEKDSIFSFFNTAIQGYKLYDSEPIIGNEMDEDGNDYYDLNRDGKYDIKIIYGSTTDKIINLGNLTENKSISLPKDFIKYLWDNNLVKEYYSGINIQAKVDIEKVKEVPATCEQDGTKEYWKAKETGYLYSDQEGKNKIDSAEIIPKLGHDWGEWKVTKEATVTEEGTEERVCKHDASHKEQRAISKLTPTPTPTASPEDRAKQMGEDGTAFSKGASEEAAEATITSYASEKDPKGTAFGLLQAKASKVTKNSIKLSWKKQSEAATYVIYGNKCGSKNKYEKITTVTGNSYTAKKVVGKKVKKGTYYKFLIVALDKDGNVISTSKTIHAATKGGKVGNDKKVTTRAKKNKVSLKVGKTFKLKAKTKAESKKLKVKKHRAVAYESSDPTVATVNSKGVIKAVGKGECEVYAYAQNGVSIKIKVKVK